VQVNSFPRHGKPGVLAGMRDVVPRQFAQQAPIAAGTDEQLTPRADPGSIPVQSLLPNPDQLDKATRAP
jgi:hypothetical protein